MGKASKWFRGLLGLKKTESPAASADSPSKTKRRWSFLKTTTPTTTSSSSYTQNDNNHVGPTSLPQQQQQHPFATDDDPNKQHAVAVAAATAAVAEAAVAAAQAAAAVVRLTSSGRSVVVGVREEWAAVKIQAAFRGSLARKALRALKGLVKLQALVRGHIERKRSGRWLKRMRAQLRAQARRHTQYLTAKSSTYLLHGPGTPDKFESPIRSRSMKYDQSPILKRNGSKSCGSRSDSQGDDQSWTQGRSSLRTCSSSKNDEKSDRILEIDSVKQQVTLKRRSLFFSQGHGLVSDHYGLSMTSKRDSTSLKSGQTSSCEIEETPFCTASNSPQYLSATSKDEGSKRSPFTPTRSDGSRSYPCDYPSYMAYTESSKAKVRSLSAPKQRPQYDRSSSSTRYSLNGFGESRMAMQRASALQTGFTSKAYPGSGRLDKLGMPVGYKY